VWQHFPGILHVFVVGRRTNSVDGFRELKVVVPETTHKIGELITCKISESEIKAAVIEEVEDKVVADSANIRPEFPFMLLRK
jgi:hypothetical protein